MELSELIYRAVNDESLRNLLQTDVEKAAASVEANLSHEELAALTAVSWDASPSATSHTPQGPDQWWVRQLSHCPTPVGLSPTV
jgi:hypothetical protein